MNGRIRTSETTEREREREREKQTAHHAGGPGSLAALARQARDGDAAAHAALLDGAERLAREEARRAGVRDPQDRHDIGIDVRSVVARCFASGARVTSALVGTVARRRSVDHVRDAVRRQAAESAADPPPAPRTPEDIVAERERLAAFGRMIETSANPEALRVYGDLIAGLVSPAAADAEFTRLETTSVATRKAWSRLRQRLRTEGLPPAPRDDP